MAEKPEGENPAIAELGQPSPHNRGGAAMSVLFGLLWPLERFNAAILAVGRVIAVIALAIMVCLILGQVFRGKVRIEIGKRGVARAFFLADTAQFHQSFDDRLCYTRSFGQFAKGQG